jgi:hypothetical protein
VPARAVGGGQKAGHVQAGDAPAAKPVSALADPATARAMLTATESLIDGSAAAPRFVVAALTSSVARFSCSQVA